MRSLRIFNRRAGFLFGAASLALATTIPALVSAATVTSRSIALSSSAKSATGVSYEVKFTTAASSTGAYEIDFCTTPDIGTACTAPDATLDTSGVDVDGTSTTAATASSPAVNSVKVVITTPVTAGNVADVILTGIDNPATSGVMYARIATYTDSSAMTSNYTAPDDLGSYLDSGSVAMTITDGFNVGGSVLETMTFCAADNGSTIGSGCTGTLGAPDIDFGTLGTTPTTGTIKTQISTNAAHGAVVSLKSDASDCGGLVRVGADTNADGCGIAPLTDTGSSHATIADNAAQFGMVLANLGGADSTTTVASGNYSDTDYYMGYTSGNSAGVTSTYGDQIYNTGDGPVSDGTANLTFGADISNLTPAGTYRASFSLIATGTF